MYVCTWMLSVRFRIAMSKCILSVSKNRGGLALKGGRPDSLLLRRTSGNEGERSRRAEFARAGARASTGPKLLVGGAWVAFQERVSAARERERG